MTDETPASPEPENRAARGAAIRQRVYQGRSRPVIPIAAIAREADLSRETIYAVLAGDASDESIAAVEQAVFRLESGTMADRAAHPEDYAADVTTVEGGMAVVELYGLYGVGRVVVKAAPDLLHDELLATLQAIREAGIAPSKDDPAP